MIIHYTQNRPARCPPCTVHSALCNKYLLFKPAVEIIIVYLLFTGGFQVPTRCTQTENAQEQRRSDFLRGHVHCFSYNIRAYRADYGESDIAF